MAGISTSISVQDRVSGTLNRITASLYNTTSAFGAVDRASDVAFNPSGVQAMAQEMYRYEDRIQQLESDLVNANNRLEQMEEQTHRTAQAGNTLKNAFRGVVGMLSAIGVGKILQTSDELVQTTSRIDMMNDGLQGTDELMDMIYQSAQNARGGFTEMADVVARFGNNVGIGENSVFGSSEEVVAFTELVQKQMTIAGASTAEASAAMLQLSQGLGSGVLRGDELNSIFEQSPNLIRNIANYIQNNEEVAKHMASAVDVSYEEMSTNAMGHIRDLASEGQLSADLVKNAIFSASGEINTQFENMPMTWGQVWQSIQNTALMKFQPVLDRINKLASSDEFQGLVDGLAVGMATVANVVLDIFDMVGAVGSFVSENWSVIEPIVMGVVAALGLYLAIMAVTNTVNAISAAMTATKAAADMMAGGATFFATAAQHGLNAALMACPLTWIILLIIALIAVIIAVCNWIANMGGTATTAFGVISGGVNVVLQFFKNLGLSIANIGLGIWNALGAVAENLEIAFHNTIANIQSWFYGMLSTVLTVVAGIAEALNKLPFVEFDYSGISDKAQEYANKAAEAEGSKKDYVSIGDAFNEGMSTFDTFQEGWVGDAYDAGAKWGDGVTNKISSGLDDMFGGVEVEPDPNTTDYLAGISEDTSDIKDSVDISDENLKYLRDMAERDVINRFTTAEIKVDMKNTNNINSGMDIDGIVEQLTVGVQEAMEQAAEGVH